jgi:hypothetical protein
MDVKATREPRGSLIGVRGHWTCCLCHATATTHQLVDAADPTLDLPVGWHQRKGRTYCPAATAMSTNLILKEVTQ